MKRYINFPYIYEYDLKGAFPSVSIKYAKDRLIQLDCPEPIANYVYEMSLLTVERIDRDDQKLPEPKTDRQEFLESLLGSNHPLFTPNNLGLKPRFVMGEGGGIEVVYDDGPFSPGEIPPPDGGLPPIHMFTMNSQFLTNRSHDVHTEPDITGKRPVPLEQRGFPQGSGLSPILFDFVFEDVIKRSWLYQIAEDYGAKIVAYADDFLIFCKDLLPDMFFEDDRLDESGLTFSKEKSRPVVLDGQPQVMSFKFLGIKILFFGKEIIVSGAPRSGKTLEFDTTKQTAIRKFQDRDHDLLEFSRSLDLGQSPQEVLDSWGNHDYPAELLPEEVINGDRRLDRKTIKAIKALVDLDAKAGGPSAFKDELPSDTTPKTIDPLAQRIASIDANKIRQSLSDADLAGYARMAKWISKTNPTAWLGSRKAGLIMSRLYDGTWHRAADNSSNFDLQRSVKPSTKGRSWYDLAADNQIMVKGIAPTLHNSTSLAMLDMLILSKSPKAIKIGRSSLHYRPQKGYNYKGR